MAQTGYTPIQLYYSTTAAAVPVNTNLANGELAINITDGKLYYKDNTGTVKLLAGATAGPAGGSNTQVQYNSSGVLAGSANMTFDGTTLTAAGFSGPLNGTVGATTPSTGAFTTIRSSTGASSAIFGGGSSSNEVVTITAQTGGLGIGLGIQNSSSNLSGISFPTNASATTAYTYITADGRSGASGFIKSYVNDAVVSTLTSTGLGIGTSSPDTRLTVLKNSNADFSSQAALRASSLQTFSNTNVTTAVVFNGLTGNPDKFISVDNQGGTQYFSLGYLNGSTKYNVYQFDQNGGLYLSTNATERLRIASTGAFGLSGANYGTSGQVLTSGGSGAAPTWTTVSGAGDVVGPASATNNGIALFDGTTGKLLKNSSAQDGLIYGLTVGRGAGAVSSNTALGSGALNNASTTGGFNTALGRNTLQTLTSGEENTAVGNSVLNLATTGSNNVGVGNASLAATTTGGSNTALGVGALQRNTSASFNTAIGTQALTYNTTASGNTAVGYRAGFTNTTNTNLTAVGKEALLNSTGADNNAFGQSVLRSNTTGYSNSAFGGAGNFVAPAMTANTTGYNNSAFGNGALASNTTAANNVAVGHTALYNNSTGGSHVAVGQGALQANTTASGNTAIGYETAYTNTTGVQITALGHQAAKAGTTANYITAIGYAALLTNTTGGDNVAVGASAMELNTTGGDNTAVGDAALYANTTGAQNVSVGRNAGNSITTGSQNVCVGFDTDASAAGGLGQITIGYGLTGQGNYHVTMGTSSSKIYVNYTSTGTWTQTSDATLKNVIGQETLGLSFINRLNPVTFTWKSQTDLPVTHPHYSTANKKNTTTVMHGLLAQDVKAAMDAENCSTFNGWDQGPDGVQAVSREMFITPLIKAIQELTAQVESLKARLDAANL